MMIRKLTVRNFKKLREQEFEFTDFDLLVGTNNSGKSTVLQALAIWQFCVDEFHRSKRSGKTGIQVVLPNFTALPLPEFNLLWFNRTEREYPQENGKKKQQFISIQIVVQWEKNDGQPHEFGVSMRYQTPQSLYAIPQKGWEDFRRLDKNNELPRIVYVPPFSGLEPSEIWLDDGVVRKNVGKAQPGSVLRNLLFRVIDRSERNEKGELVPVRPEDNAQWLEFQKTMRQWFGITVNPPQYEKGVSTEIKVTYTTENEREYDIISGGSGFHQALTLLAFYYGYPGITAILFDEPDAHMHVNLQRNVLTYLKNQKRTQFIIATHAEEFIYGVEAPSIISILSSQPRRIQTTAAVVRALADVDNVTVMKTLESPFILYLEGNDDDRIVLAWANVLAKSLNVLDKFCILHMKGGTKEIMKAFADKHFEALREIVPNIRRMMVFDYDSDETAFHPEADNPALFEWRRKNIENYLLVPDAWKRAVLDRKNLQSADIFTSPTLDLIDRFFQEQNLTLPPGSNWSNVKANIFSEVNGKKILFHDEDSLFQRILTQSELSVNRESVAINMTENEIHDDVKKFFEKLEQVIRAQ